MSWLYSQVLVEEYLGDISSDGEQSVQSNGNPTQQAYCAPDKMTDFSRLSRFGMTYKPLTENRGEELLMLYREDFRAKTSQLQEKEMDLKDNDQECGEKWGGLLARYDQDAFLWKIPQCSLLEDSIECLEIFPKWGLMQNGVLWEQTPLGPITKETEFGSWPTPNAWDGKRGPRSEENLKNKKHQINLITAVQIKERIKWPSPKARDWKDGTSEGLMNRQSPDLGKVVGQSKQTGSLNPTWVEWLMGWPLGWTDLKPLEMDKSLCVQQQHGEF